MSESADFGTGVSTDSGGGADFSTSTDGSSNGSPVGSPVQNQPTEQPDNPAWKPFLDELPEMFQNRARPHLRKWDENYRARETELKSIQEKYSPYERYVGVDPGAIHYALGLLNQVQTNPMAVYEALAEHVRQQGLLKDDTSANQDPDSQDLNTDPRYAELERRQKQVEEQQQNFQKSLEEQAYNQQVASYEDAINQQVDQIRKQFGNAVDVQDLLQRMFLQIQRGEEFNALKAYEEQKGTFQRMYSSFSQGRPAPNVLSPGGQPAPNAPTNKAPKDMSEQERKEYFKYLLDAANAGG